jgi:hypothetical protein
MKAVAISVVMVVSIVLVGAVNLSAEPLRGVTDSSTRYGVGWLDLESFTDFKKGDRLKIKIGGTARKVLVRFLAKGVSPDSPDGIEGGPLQVPADRVLTITLSADHHRVAQISVHGGPNPWGIFPLGEDNGRATVVSVERIFGEPEGYGASEKE